MTPRRRPEKAEQAAIVQLLRSIGATVYVLGTTRRKGDYQGTMQTPGIPDLWVFLPPATPARMTRRSNYSSGMWLEVKAPGGKLSPAQVVFQASCDRCSVDYLCGGLDAVVAWLRAGGWVK